MLSRFLPKDGFGDLMTAFGFYRLAGVALGVAARSFYCSTFRDAVDDRQAEIRLQRFSALMGAIPSTAIAVLAICVAPSVASALSKPSLGVWLQQLAPFLVFTTLLIIATGALEGRSRIAEIYLLG